MTPPYALVRDWLCSFRSNPNLTLTKPFNTLLTHPFTLSHPLSPLPSLTLPTTPLHLLSTGPIFSLFPLPQHFLQHHPLYSPPLPLSHHSHPSLTPPLTPPSHLSLTHLFTSLYRSHHQPFPTTATFPTTTLPSTQLKSHPGNLQCMGQG